MDPKQKKQLIAVVCLLLVLGAVWYVAIYGLPLPEAAPVAEPGLKADPAPPADMPDEETMTALMERASELRAGLEAEAPEPLRDIFMPAKEAAAPPVAPEAEEPDQEPETVERVRKPEFQLDAIIWADDDPLALIDERILRVGDRVAENVTVKEIFRESVTLSLIQNDTYGTLELSLIPE